MYQYYRIAAAVPDMRVADTAYNVDQMLQKVEEAKQKGVNLITFPELSVTGYTCGDLFLQQTLLTKKLPVLYRRPQIVIWLLYSVCRFRLQMRSIMSL